MGHWRAEGGCPRFGRKGDERAIYDEEDVWDDNEVVEDGERARRVLEEEERGDALRRAFEVQMRMVDEVRRDLIRREAERVRGVGEEEGRDGTGEGRERRRRRKRRDGSAQVDGQAGERHVLRRRENEARRRDTSNDSGEPEPRRRRGLRAFLHDAIDATEHVLFGGPPRSRQ